MVKTEQKFYNLFLEPLTPKQFEKYFDEIKERMLATLESKGEEYVRNNDRLHNFNQASKKRFEQRERSLDGMRLKHEISIDDIINDIERGLLPEKAVVMEKFGDRLIYDILEQISIMHRIDLSGTHPADL